MAEEEKSSFVKGIRWDDPGCLHTVEEAVELIDRYGFLPLFRNGIPGFSLEDHTAGAFWWGNDPEKDPWVWREVISRSGRAAYGKFFEKKAGFISLEWLPCFANYRRDGYDFDSLYEDGKAPRKHKYIMDLFLEDRAGSRILSNEAKKLAGFGKEGEKGFDTAVNTLMMQTYLCCSDFRKRKNKAGLEYGWSVAELAAPEDLFGYDLVRSAYSEDPEESLRRILRRVAELFPGVSDAAALKAVK